MMTSDNVVSHLTRNDDDDTSKDLMTFCMTLVHHSQWKSQRMFVCGSFVEITHYHLLAKYCEVGNDKLDIDFMLYLNSCYAFNRSASLLKAYSGDIIRIYTDDVHTGYVRLIREKDNIEVRLTDMYRLQEDETLHGPAVLIDNNKSFTTKKYYSLSNADTDRHSSAKNVVTHHDIVCAVHSPYWPVEATEWITRRRSYGFPSKSVIEQVVRYGCDFVQVSHNRLSNDGEWRFSFSKAELFIIKSWPLSRRIVYITLWVLNKKIASSNLCSYYFKTLMFWACEEKPTQFWHDDLLVHSVRELLIEMIKWINSTFCANYFIPGNNMMDHLIGTDLSYEINALWRMFESRQEIYALIQTCRKYESQSASTIYHIESPAWIKRAYVIYQRVNNRYDNYRDLFCTSLTKDLQYALHVELSDIYRGLCFQQKSVSCINVSDKYSYVLRSESHLLLAVNLFKSVERDVLDNCNEEFVQSTLNSFVKCYNDVSRGAKNDSVQLSIKRRPTANRQDSVKDHNELKRLLYSRSAEKHENQLLSNNYTDRISEIENITIAVYRVTVLNTKSSADSNVVLYKERPDRSPTVNVSWFIAKAYLANLYYTTQCKVSLTIQTCDDIIDVYRQSLMSLQFAEQTFLVILSTQWTSIYDKEIQEQLGFYSLCSYVFDASSRSVYLGVCPVQFALYLKLRVAMNQLKGDNLSISNTRSADCVFSVSTIKEYCDHWNKHLDACECDRKVNNGLLMAGMVLNIMLRNIHLQERNTNARVSLS